MQLAKPVEGALIVRAGPRIYLVLIILGSVLSFLVMHVAWAMPEYWQTIAIAGTVFGPLGYCLLWLVRLRVELTNQTITYRTLCRTTTFALADLRPPVVEVGEDTSRTATAGPRRPTRPIVRLVLSPYKHPLKRRIDLNLMQLDPVAMRALILHLGARNTDGED